MIDRVQELGTEWGAQAEQLKERALQYTAAARERVTEGSERIKNYTVKEPVRALGIALGLGVLVGWLIKRR
jgi:ElaB/YqjD/DUF883 family membrane-anchored ribosome-binding protein